MQQDLGGGAAGSAVGMVAMMLKRREAATRRSANMQLLQRFQVQCEN